MFKCLTAKYIMQYLITRSMHYETKFSAGCVCVCVCVSVCVCVRVCVPLRFSDMSVVVCLFVCCFLIIFPPLPLFFFQTYVNS